MGRLRTRFWRAISEDEHLFVAWGSFGCGFVPTNAGGIRILNGEDPLPAPPPSAGRQGRGQFAEGIGGRRKREGERERKREKEREASQENSYVLVAFHPTFCH